MGPRIYARTDPPGRVAWPGLSLIASSLQLQNVWSGWQGDSPRELLNCPSLARRLDRQQDVKPVVAAVANSTGLITSIDSYFSEGSAELVSEDRGTTYALLNLWSKMHSDGMNSSGKIMDVVDELETPPWLSAYVTGLEASHVDITDAGPGEQGAGGTGGCRRCWSESYLKVKLEAEGYVPLSPYRCCVVGCECGLSPCTCVEAAGRDGHQIRETAASAEEAPIG